MKSMTKIIGLGLGVLGLFTVAGSVGIRALRRRRAMKLIDEELAAIEELDEPVVVAEEIIIVTEPDPYLEMQTEEAAPATMPGRDAGPR
jgi:hypothetical protein